MDEKDPSGSGEYVEKPNLKPITNSKKYRDFIKERNKALEHLLDFYLSQIDDVVSKLHYEIEQIAVHLYALSNYQDIHWEQVLYGPFQRAINKTVVIAHRMRRTIYLLAYAGEAEGIGRALGVPTKVDLGVSKILRVVNKQSPSGGLLDKRIQFEYRRILRDVVEAIEYSVLKRDLVSARNLVEDIEFAFPRVKKVRWPNKRIQKPKRIAEAKQPTLKKDFLVTGIIDQDAWDELVQDYLDANIPLRGPEDMTTIVTDTGEAVDRYSWEVEKEITQDFLDQVRSAQIDSAKENGVKEFMWIAVMDAKTDDCCSIRDGKTTQEIESMIAGNEDVGGCDAIVPPAHFNCRCDIAPMVEEDFNTEPLQLGDFESWLK